LRVYLAGIGYHLVSVGVLCQISVLGVTFGTDAILQRIVATLILLNILEILGQAQIFMRTDLYFVVLEALRRQNLHAESLEVFHWVLSEIYHRSFGPRSKVRNPLAGQSASYQFTTYLYSFIVLLGSVTTVVAFLIFSGPILVQVFALCFEPLQYVNTSPHDAIVDGLIGLTVESFLILSFLLVFAKKYASKFKRSLLSRSRY
jgi:hypothetical protein